MIDDQRVSIESEIQAFRELQDKVRRVLQRIDDGMTHWTFDRSGTQTDVTLEYRNDLATQLGAYELAIKGCERLLKNERPT